MKDDLNYEEEPTRKYLRTIAFVLMAVLGPLAAFFINEGAEEKAILEAQHYQEERAQITLSRIRAFLLNATQLSETLRVLVEQNYTEDLSQIETYLDRIVESAPEDLIYGAGVWYEPNRFDPKKTFVGPYVHRGNRTGSRILSREWEAPTYNFHKQEWYRHALEGKGLPTFTEPYFDNGQVYMTLAISFNDRKNGSIRGVVTVDMILPQLQSLIDSVNENSTDVIMVLGKKGNLLAHPQNFTLLDEARADEGKEKIKSLLDVPQSYFKGRGWNILRSEMRMKENGWTVVVESPKTSVLAGYLSQRTLIIALTIFFEVALLIIYMLMGFYDEGINRLKERSFQAVMAERNQIKAIVDNVQFGLFRADRRGRIQSGYSQSCTKLFSVDPKSDLNRRVFWHYLGLSRREEENIEGFFEQIFELPFLAQEMAEQMPSQFLVRGKTLSCRYYPILKGDIVESVLVSFADVSRSRLTAEENEGHKALIMILRNKDRFQSLVSEIFHSDDAILSAASWPQLQPEQAMKKIRRLVHTWKGEFATFGLNEVASYMHGLEEELRPRMSLSQASESMRSIKSLVENYLELNKPLLRIERSQLSDRYIHLKESQIIGLKEYIFQAKSLEEAQTSVESFVEINTQETAESTLSYLKFAAEDLAKKQEKQLKVSLVGSEIRYPKDFEPVMTSLIHLVRNAVDHGIERPKDRLNKSPMAHMEILFKDNPDHLLIALSDDGRGIDRDKIKARVLKEGLMKEDEWQALSADEQMEFIFKDSISTQTNVTAISGRGVGLDRVLSSVEGLGGKVKVTSIFGEGTRFEILLKKQKLMPLIDDGKPA